MRYSGCQTKMMHSATSAHMAAQPSADSGFLPASVTTEMNAPSPVALRGCCPLDHLGGDGTVPGAAGGGDDARHDVGKIAGSM